MDGEDNSKCGALCGRTPSPFCSESTSNSLGNNRELPEKEIRNLQRSIARHPCPHPTKRDDKLKSRSPPNVNFSPSLFFLSLPLHTNNHNKHSTPHTHHPHPTSTTPPQPPTSHQSRQNARNYAQVSVTPHPTAPPNQTKRDKRS